MTRQRYLWTTVALFAAAAAHAHHSAAMFDLKQTDSVKGSVKIYQWTNPHGFIYLNAADGDGNVVEYSIELTSPNLLARRGWRPTSLKVGDEVTIVFNPFRDGSKGGRVVSVTTPNGKVLTERDAQ